MKVNVGSAERIARIAFGVGLLSLTVFGPQTAWGFLGLVPLFTGISGWCPPYSMLGINTCRSCKNAS